MSSLIKWPLDYNISYCGAALDYTHPATWESDTDNDLVTATKGEVLFCSSNLDFHALIVSGATVDANYHRLMMPTPDLYHKGIPGGRGRIIDTSASNALLISIGEDHFGFHNFDITCDVPYRNPSSGGGFITTSGGSRTGIRIVGNIAYDIWARHWHFSIFAITLAASGYCVVANNSFVDMYNYRGDGDITYGIKIGGDVSANAYVFNNTLANWNQYGGASTHHGIYVNGPTVEAKNNIFQGLQNDTTVISGTLNQTTNIPSTSTVNFENEVLYDYRLSRSDTVAKNQGTDLSADPNYPFDIDCRGILRPKDGSNWDCGHHERRPYRIHRDIVGT